MSLRLTADVLDYAPYEGGALLVLLALASWANDDGTKIFPKIESLAQKARLGVRATQYALRQLEDDGVLTVVSAGRGRKTTEYRLEVQIMHHWTQDIEGENERCKKCTSDDEGGNCRQMHLSGAARCTSEVQSATSPIDNHSSTQSLNPSLSRAPQRASESKAVSHQNIDGPSEGVQLAPKGAVLAAWPQIWNAFMAVPGASAAMSEVKARGVYERMLAAGEAIPEPENLVAAIGVYATEVLAANATRRGDMLRIPHPHTWLTERRWLQYAGAAREAKRAQQGLSVRACAAAEGLGTAGFERLRAAGISDAEIEGWFTGCTGQVDADAPVICVPSRFRADEIEKRFGPRLRKAEAFGPNLRIDVRSGSVSTKVA